jgi:hypothetical protein
MCQPDDAGGLPAFAGHGIGHSRSDFRACVFGRRALRLRFRGRRRHPAGLPPLKYHAYLALITIVAYRCVDQDDQHHYDKCNPKDDCFLHVSVARHQRPAGMSREEVPHPPEFLVALLHQFFTGQRD